MLNWIRKKLGILALEARADRADNEFKRIHNKMREGRRPQRYDEIERDRKRRKKAA